MQLFIRTKKGELWIGDTINEKLPEDLWNMNPAVIITDPPWSDRNIKYWYTILKRTSGMEYNRPYTLQELLQTILKFHCSYDPLFTFLECSIKSVKHYFDFFVKAGVQYVVPVRLCYRSGSILRPSGAVVLSNDKIILSITEYLSKEMFGIAVYKAIYRFLFEEIDLRSITVFDPFCGRGNVFRPLKNSGRKYYAVGIDINPARLEKAVRWIRES